MLCENQTVSQVRPPRHRAAARRVVGCLKFDFHTRCYGGSTAPAAFLYLSSLGSIDPDTNKATSAAVADILEAELGVPKGRYYINFFDSERSNMGYNGGTF